MISRIVQAFCALMLACLAFPHPSLAQTQPPNTVTGLLRLVSIQLGGEQSARVLAALAGLEVSTAPLGTSTGAFTRVLDPKTGLKVWAASGFGPTFSERSLTSGRGAFSIGANFLHSSYGSFAGQDLKGDGLRLVQNAGGAWGLSSSTLNLTLTSDTMVAFATAGLSDDLDVGVAVPWIQVAFDAFGREYSSSGQQLPDVPSITNAVAAGMGDIAVFGKYRFWKQAAGGAAVAVEVRLPSGNKDDLRGLGVSRTLVSGIWSGGTTFSPHAKFGYEFWSKEVPISGPFLLGATIANAPEVAAKNQVVYSFGFDYVANAHATVTFDVVGGTLLGGGQVEYQRFAPFGSPIEVLVGVPKSLTRISIVPGVKWNIWGGLLLTANLLTTVSNNGLKANFTPVIGFDWSLHK